MTKADEFKARRKADYADMQEYFDLVLSVDPKCYVRRNMANNAEIVFIDGSTYVIGTNA